MSAHILTDDLPISTGTDIQARLNAMLAGRYRISHATLQLECVGCDPASLYCDIHAIHTHEATH